MSDALSNAEPMDESTLEHEVERLTLALNDCRRARRDKEEAERVGRNQALIAQRVEANAINDARCVERERIDRWHEARHIAMGALIGRWNAGAKTEEIVAEAAAFADACHGALVQT